MDEASKTGEKGEVKDTERWWGSEGIALGPQGANNECSSVHQSLCSFHKTIA